MTDRPCPLDLERLVDGELSAKEAEACRAHVAGCEACTAELKALEDLNAALRQGRDQETAPPELRARIDLILSGQDAEASTVSPAAPGPRLSRRHLGLAAFGALAASVAGAVVLPKLLVSRLEPEDIAATLIRDFETFLFAERVLDLIEDDPASVVTWYRDRLDFGLPRLPAEIGGYRLRGGRLCWLFDRRLASLSFETGEEALALYIMRSDGTDLQDASPVEASGLNASIHRQDRFTNVIWRDGGLVFGLVGEAAPERVEALAQLISPGLRG